MSTLAKAAFELLKWRLLSDPHLQKAVSIILSSANDSNWRTRSATLTFLRSFMYRCVTLIFFLYFLELDTSYRRQHCNGFLSLNLNSQLPPSNCVWRGGVFAWLWIVIEYIWLFPMELHPCMQAYFRPVFCGEATNLENSWDATIRYSSGGMFATLR